MVKYKHWLNTMRNSIDIIPNPSLKGLSCIFPTLPSIPPGTILKLTQNETSIFTKYNPSDRPSSGTFSSGHKAQLPAKLCELNGIKDGSMQVEAISGIRECRKLTLYVSRLDWQIISNKASRLEEEFMNQVDLVWPGAKLAVFYDNSNCVALRVQCDGLGVLVQNSELEVLVEEDGSQKPKQQQKVYECEAVMVLPVSILPSGNINKIFILKDHQILTQNAAKPSGQSMKKVKESLLTQDSSNLKIPPTDPPSLVPSVSQKSQQYLPNLNQSYNFRLVYTKSATKQQIKFPCDTNKVSIKEQIKHINDIKAGKEKLKINEKKLEKVLVEVQIVNDIDSVQLACYKSCGKYMESYRNVKRPEKKISNEQKQQQFMKEQEEPRFETHRPEPSIIVQPLHNNAILINEALIKFLNINIKGSIELVRTPKNQELTQSKNLGYLLNMKEFNIFAQIFMRKDDQKDLEETKQQICEELIKKIIGKEEKNEGLRWRANGLTIFSKLPFMIKQNQIKFAYIYLRDGQKIIGDPLSVFHSISKKKSKLNEKKQIEERDQASLLKQKIMKLIEVQNIFYQNQNDEEINAKVAQLNKLEGIRQNKKKNIDINQQNPQQALTNEQIFIQLYQICYKEQINKLLKLLKQPSESFKLPSQKQQLSPPVPILITSFSNNGKTVMNNILRQHGYKTLYIDVSQMDDTSLVMPNLTEYLQLTFQLYKGDFLFMDNLDSVCYKIQQGDLHRKQEKIASKLLIRKIMEFSKVYKKVCIFTAKNDANLDEEFINYETIKLKNPSRELRSEILKQYYQKGNKKYQREKIQEIIQNSQSMSFGQFSKYVISGHKSQSSLQKQKVLDFSKLSGAKEAKETLRTIVQRPQKYSFVFKKLPIKLSRGVLLYGGSGTGKSAIGEALAGEFKMKFFSVKGSDILSKYIGGSQAAVRDIFQKAMTVSPSIVFFDQFESIVPRRNSSNTGVTDRVVNQFLCYLDGVASVQGVYIVAASSRPELIDPALLRPGRIDTHIFLDHPTREEREQLLRLYSNSISFETPIEEILNMTQQFSYSDLIGLIKELRIKQSAKVIKEGLSNSEEKVDQKKFKFIEDKFFREIIGSFKIPMTKKQKAKQRERFLAFKRGDAPDISKQKSILQ